jgi:hypothetical protein
VPEADGLSSEIHLDSRDCQGSRSYVNGTNLTLYFVEEQKRQRNTKGESRIRSWQRTESNGYFRVATIQTLSHKAISAQWMGTRRMGC